jgi:stage V sporulation protein R
LTNFGNPTILIEDANHKNRGELYLIHHHDGVDLDEPYARDTLRNLHALWGRPVHLETLLREQNQKICYHHDKSGSERSQI